LGRAYDGNTTSLGKLGIGLSAAELKTMSFTDVQGRLSDLFGGAAAKNAETFQGRIARLKVAFDEAKETIGFALLPIIERLVDFVVNQVVPNLQKFASAFDPIVNAINENKDSFQRLFNFIGDYVIPILTNLAGGALKVVGEVFGRIIGIIGSAIDKIADFVESVKNMVNAVISAYNRLPTPDISLIGSGGGFVGGGAPGAISGGGNAGILAAVSGLATVSSSMAGLAGGGGGGGKGATASNKAALARLEADAAKLGDLVDQLMGVQKVDPFAYGSFRMGEAKSMQQYNITVNGAIDSESTARQIVEILNDSSARGTLGAGAFDR
jgi:phage-related protein